MSKNKVVTRFAPSPTGLIHLGNIRTAIFNWLYSKNQGGKFLLRIEDTDKQRSTPEATKGITAAMEWLGLNWDGEECYQSKNIERHKQVAQQLLEKGKAYKCYAIPEELEKFREENPNKKFRYSDSRNIAPQEKEQYAIRLKIDDSQQTEITDLVQGEVSINNAELDDMILLRSDGTPTYLLAAVVDDNDMGVTHVLRGTDHLTNAFRQIQIIDAMEWKRPIYGHIPLIHNIDGSKMSKRSGDMDLQQYMDSGYLPEAMFNYLLRLGWSHGDEEYFTKNDAIKLFDINGIGKSPAKFDLDKLNHYQSYYFRNSEDIKEEIKKILEPSSLQNVDKAIELIRERSNFMPEAAEVAKIFTCALPPCDKSQEIIENMGKNDENFFKFIAELSGLENWQSDELKTLLKGFIAREGVKMGNIMPKLRALIARKFDSPAILDVMEVLGKEECLKRVEQILETPKVKYISNIKASETFDNDIDKTLNPQDGIKGDATETF